MRNNALADPATSLNLFSSSLSLNDWRLPTRNADRNYNDSDNGSESESKSDKEDADVSNISDWEELYMRGNLRDTVLYAGSQFNKRQGLSADHVENTQYSDGSGALSPTEIRLMRNNQIKVMKKPILGIGERQTPFEDFNFDALETYGKANTTVAVRKIDDAQQITHINWKIIDFDGVRIEYGAHLSPFPVNNHTIGLGNENTFIQSWILKDLFRRQI